MPVYRLTSDNEDVATIESPDLAQAKKDGAFLLRAYGCQSGEIASRNGRTVRILGSDVLSVSTEDAGLDERFRDFVDEYHLKPGQNIGDYVIHGDADYDYYGGPYMAVWCEAENVMGTFDAGYLDFKVPIEYLFSSGMTWAQLKSVMTYTYDATVTDDLANSGFWGDDPGMESVVGKARSKVKSKMVQMRGRSGNGAGQSFTPQRRQLNFQPLYESAKDGTGRQSTFEVDPPRNRRMQAVNRPTAKSRPYTRETTVGKDGKRRPPVKTLHCTPRISDYRSPKSGNGKGARR